MSDPGIIIIGAGIAGLTAALELSHRGLPVTLVDKNPVPGGKIREVAVGQSHIDAGPTVFTMRWVFEDLFDTIGANLEDHLGLKPMSILARHAWSEAERLDLHADVAASREAIAEFAGPAEAKRFGEFCDRARKTYQTLDGPFIRSSRPSLMQLVARVGAHKPGGLLSMAPYQSLWDALGKHFHDPRLRQLFGRYATYCGSSPFQAPATLMLVAHVEQEGVWMVDGGMARIPEALSRLASERGAQLRLGARASAIRLKNGRIEGVELDDGEFLPGSHVISNADVAALSLRYLGQELRSSVPAVDTRNRSLSAITWNLHTPTDGFPLLRHNVFFGRDYPEEFDAIFKRRQLPADPTVYICAQDRQDVDGPDKPTAERLLCLVNAPAIGDSHVFDDEEIAQCQDRMLQLLARCGLQLEVHPDRSVVTTPRDFENLFPGSGGGLYGQATHGWKASFQRPGARSGIPGLYLAGGSVHPGAGVPMASLSGRLAAQALVEDLTSRKA